MRRLVLAGGIVLAMGSSARAQEHEAVRLTYLVPAGCPDDLAFWERVTARTPGAERSDAAAGRLFAVMVERRSRRAFVGRLLVTEVPASPTERVIEAESCDEIVSALALIVAVAIAERWEEERAQAVVQPAPPPAAPPAAPPAPPPIPVPPPPRPVAEPLARARSQPFDVLVGAGVDLGIVRSGGPVLGAALTIELVQEGGPGARLTAVWAPAGTLRSAGQEAGFTWWLGRLEVCPVSSLSAGRLRLEPCVVVEAGAVAAEGVGIDDARSALRPWVAPGAGGRATLRLGRGFFFEVGVGLLAAVVRDRFHFSSGDTVLRAGVLQPVVDARLVWSDHHPTARPRGVPGRFAATPPCRDQRERQGT